MQPSNTLDYPCGITVIDTHYYREELAASHLIVENGKAAFVDVGAAPSLPYLLHALEEKQLTPEDVEFIILTHIHLDHAGGAGTLMQACPKATLIVHPRGSIHMVNPEKLVRATIDIYGQERFDQLYREIVPVPQERVIAAEDGATIDFQGRQLHFFDTPGHAKHHFCVWDPASSGVFTGDTLGIAYPELQLPGKPPFLIPTTTPAAFDLDDLLNSIKRVLGCNPDFFYLTHFGPVTASNQAVDALIDMILDHAETALETAEDDLTQLKSFLLEAYVRAYSDYQDSPADIDKLKEILGADLELNSQGLSIWAKRKMRSK